MNADAALDALHELTEKVYEGLCVSERYLRNDKFVTRRTYTLTKASHI